MTTTGTFTPRNFQRFLFAAGLFFLIAKPAFAQFVNPISVGMGGASVTMVNGLDAIGTNPAGLFLQQKGERFSVVIAQPSYWFGGPSLFSGNASRKQDFVTQFDPYQSADVFSVTNDTLQKALSDLFYHSPNTGHLTTSSEWTPFAAALRYKTQTMAIFVRQRKQQDSRFTKSLYSALAENAVTTRALEQTFRSWTEVGAAFSGELSVLSGLNPNFNSLVFGFSPRLILAGSYFSGVYTSEFNHSNDPAAAYQKRTFSQQSAGIMTDLSLPWNTGDAASFNDNVFKVSGTGLAIDLGLSYVVPGGEDFSLFNTNAPAGYLPGLKVSIAIRDLGIIRWKNNIRHIAEKSDSVSIATDDIGAFQQVFSGQPGAFTGFLNQQSSSAALLNPAETESASFREMLAPTLQTGFSLANRWATLAVESTYRSTGLKLDESVFQLHSGLEFRPASWLPLRAGILVQREVPLYYSAGMGLNTRFLQADAGLMWFSDTSREDSRTIVGASARVMIRL